MAKKRIKETTFIVFPHKLMIDEFLKEHGSIEELFKSLRNTIFLHAIASKDRIPSIGKPCGQLCDNLLRLEER